MCWMLVLVLVADILDLVEKEIDECRPIISGQRYGIVLMLSLRKRREPSSRLRRKFPGRCER